MQLRQGTSSAHCMTDVCYLSTGAGSCPCCWPAALCSTSHGYSACLQARIHLLSWSWSSRFKLHLSARLLASSQRIMSSLYLRLSDIGATVASSCQALRSPGPCATGVCTSRRPCGAEPRTLILRAQPRFCLYAQFRLPYAHPASVTTAQHLCSSMSPRLPCQSGPATGSRDQEDRCWKPRLIIKLLSLRRSPSSG
jgi:hypothetical protein